MGVASKYNKERKFTYNVPQGLVYTNLEQLMKRDGAGAVYMVHALYINTKGHYGDSPVAATDTAMVNLPSHMLGTVKDMLEDDEVIQAVNDGKFGFTIYEYTTQNCKSACYSAKWVDIP